jgi:hypothetical protein
VSNSRKANVVIKSEQINKDFENIQKFYNAHLKEKLRTKVDKLYSLERKLNVKYILIKKMDINEEFLLKLKIIESNK